MTGPFPAPKIEGQKLGELEGLRGILAWWVVVAHAYATSGMQAKQPLPLWLQPEQAVEVFMMLSGFVIFMVLDKGESPKGFYLRRFFRIYPVYLIALMAGTLLWMLMPAQVVDPMLEESKTVSACLGVHLGAHVMMIHGMIPEEILPYSALALLPPGWSLSLEAQFYVLAPLLFVFCRRPSAAALAVVGCLLAARFAAHAFKSEWVFGMAAFFPLRLEFFMVGAASFFMWKRVESADRAFVREHGWALLSLTIPVFLLTRSIPLVLWVAVMITLLAGRQESAIWPLALARKILSFRGLQRLGKWSYSTYCLHWPVLVVTAWGLFRNQPNFAAEGKFLLLSVVAGLATLVLSWQCFERIEMRWIDFGRHLAKRSENS
jgi:peptidoglycan/LPS O-acetylase OafA/YrhL